MKSTFSFLACLASTIFLVWLLSFRFGMLPPLGPFFHPGEGFWAHAEVKPVTGEIHLPALELKEPVDIYFNERGVPHIFANNDYDLYFAQGFVTARDRLFQLELQVRSAGGFLAEWFGESLLETDLYQRRHGMVYGAEKTLTTFKNDEVGEMVQAYTDGINAYTRSLNSRQLPLEYKIFGVEPEEWTPMKTALLLKYMTQMLAGGSWDVQTSNTIAYLGKEFTDRYIATPSRWTDPIIPVDQDWPFEPVTSNKPEEPFTPQWVEDIPVFEPNPSRGSNNWAVDGGKTASGYPILSGDPHLGLSLPSIWYEIQLNAPGINVYGVSIPGTPSVIKGFNRDIGWMNTNTGADVMDWYEVEFRDERKMEYLHDGEWKPVKLRLEEVHVRDNETVIDTIRYTHHGPVVQIEGDEPIRTNIAPVHAMKWIGHYPSDESRAYYKLNRATSVQEAQKALRHFSAPAQNFAIADRHGSIAMQIAGRFPVKWQGQGMTISDGRSAAYDWNQWIPYDHNPQIVNPKRGFVSSANQKPTDDFYPYYLGETFAPFERGRRINDLLSGMESITPEDMQQLQLDNYSYHAALALPVMLDHLNIDSPGEFEENILELLHNWNYQKLGDKIAPSFFYLWWTNFYQEVWSGLYRDFPLRRPSRDRTIELMLAESDSHWFRQHEENQTGSLQSLLKKTFRKTVDEMNSGSNESGNSWKWAHVNMTSLNHLGQIPGLGEQELETDGAAESLNAIYRNHGPSWRMVVEFGPELRAYGVYPGGQSGNPGSPAYTEYVDTWLHGDYFELHLLSEKPAEVSGSYPLVLRLGE